MMSNCLFTCSMLWQSHASRVVHKFVAMSKPFRDVCFLFSSIIIAVYPPLDIDDWDILLYCVECAAEQNLEHC